MIMVEHVDFVSIPTRDVERAIAKMDASTYGTCERCGNAIPPERLEALPWAVLCIDCKQKGVAG